MISSILLQLHISTLWYTVDGCLEIPITLA
jgi:hypothetical protein